MNWSSPSGHFSIRRRARILGAVAVAGLVVAGVAGAVVSRSQVAPANSSPPTVSGSADVGATVTANPGTWTGSAPITFQYQWMVCDGNGNACHNIAGATAQTYKIASGDAGNTLRVHVIASNADGSSTATSAATPKVGGAASNPSAPANSSPPTVSGDATVGSTLTANPGTWTGASPISFKYQWLVCDGTGNACHNIGGATSQTYKVASGDSGNTLRVSVTASNSSGSSSSVSAATAKVSVTAPQTGCPKLAAGAQAVSVNDVAAPARLQVDQFVPSSTPITRGMTSFSVRFHVTDTCGQAVSGALVYVTAVPYKQVATPAEAATDAGGWVTLTFNRLSGFPTSRNQQLMVLFVRARKSGDPLLSGISTRRLISLRVNLHR
ncbi:MAG TPA: hypothetical protein VFB42_03090 [Gaiellaceae bacterium]|nr:hypothetical protein [Gaiellaceae bacterium]